jgi:hypothetical protein
MTVNRGKFCLGFPSHIAHRPFHLTTRPRLRSGTAPVDREKSRSSFRTNGPVPRSRRAVPERSRGAPTVVRQAHQPPRPRASPPAPLQKERGAGQVWLITASLQLAGSGAIAVTSHSPFATCHSPLAISLPATSLTKLSIRENANHRLPRSLMEEPM